MYSKMIKLSAHYGRADQCVRWPMWVVKVLEVWKTAMQVIFGVSILEVLRQK